MDRQKVIDIALAEVGYLEKASASQLDDKTANAGNNNFTKYARDLDAINGFYNTKKNGFAWCDVFVDWCFVRAYGVGTAKKLLNQPDKSLGAGCLYSANYYKAAGRFYKSPQAGDQIFFYSGSSVTHTGLVYKVEGSKVYTVEGNTSGASGVVANGGGVCKKSYTLGYGKIYGYGRPAYGDSAPAPVPEKNDKPLAFKVGDVVQFTGSKHYASANATSGPACKAGKAKITAISKNGKHPYHVIAVSGKSSNVYGWVDVDDVKACNEAQSFKEGDKVKCNAGVTKYSDGSRMPSWVPSSVLYVRQVENGGKILLVSTEPKKAIYTGRVNASDVHKI